MMGRWSYCKRHRHPSSTSPDFMLRQCHYHYWKNSQPEKIIGFWIFVNTLKSNFFLSPFSKGLTGRSTWFLHSLLVSLRSLVKHVLMFIDDMFIHWYLCQLLENYMPLLLIGLYFWRRGGQNTGEFLLASRQMGWVTIASFIIIVK